MIGLLFMNTFLHCFSKQLPPGRFTPRTGFAGLANQRSFLFLSEFRRLARYLASIQAAAREKPGNSGKRCRGIPAI